jgi:hypothetical protein
MDVAQLTLQMQNYLRFQTSAVEVVEVSALLQCCVVKVGSLLPIFWNSTGHTFHGTTIWDRLTLQEGTKNVPKH